MIMLIFQTFVVTVVAGISGWLIVDIFQNRR